MIISLVVIANASEYNPVIQLSSDVLNELRDGGNKIHIDLAIGNVQSELQNCEIIVRTMHGDPIIDSDIHYCNCINEFARELRDLYIQGRSNKASEIGTKHLNENEPNCWRFSKDVLSCKLLDTHPTKANFERCIQYYVNKNSKPKIVLDYDSPLFGQHLLLEPFEI